MLIGERKAIISGIGQSAVGRRLGRSPLDLTLDAILEALDDAGLKTKDIDGMCHWPGMLTAPPNPPGMSPLAITDIKEALRLKLKWYSGGSEGPGPGASIVDACAAVAAGYARHVLCFRAVYESSAQAALRAAPPPEHPPKPERVVHRQYLLPYSFTAANWIGQYASRHFHEYGTTRQQLAQIALNARRNAALNPKGVYTDPLTLEDYMGARMISSPLCLLDCDVPVDGATAIIVSHRDAARDLASPGIQVEAVGSALRDRDSWEQHADLTTFTSTDAARAMWERTDLKPADVDVALMYDGFSFLTLAWLEANGFCGKGEGGAFVEGGQRIALDGELPLNPHGGQLSSGRTHGFGFIHEAVVQLRGRGGARQVKGDPRVAAVSVGGGQVGVSMLLTRP